jgi:predicted Fe-Mo cluster-binding NifX family protein
MIIAITSQGKELNSEVDPRFGRAQYFIVLDTDTDQITVHDNQQNLNASQGAGIQAARNVKELKVKQLITGNIGPKAYDVLSATGIEIYIGASGSVQNAVEQWKAGTLQKAGGANVNGHWS